MRCFLLFAALLLTADLCPLTPLASAATFTTNAVISETNFAYDGQDIVVSGATLTVDGPHAFNSLLLTNGAVLTHSACTAMQTHKLDLTVSNEVVVSTNSRIDVTGQGYLAGRTSGNTTTGASGNLSGGSYGGLGGTWNTVNAVYGDYRTADDWGSGGGSCAGGGRVRVTAASLQLDGSLRANGTFCGGAGSGGGVLVVVGRLTGGGSIQAKGGDTGNNYAAGGGGRIAIYAGDSSGFNLANVSAAGGGGFIHGGAGSVYVKDTGAAAGTLVIDGGSVLSGRIDLNGWSVLGLPGTNDFTMPDAVVLRGAATRVQAEHAGLNLTIGGPLTVADSAFLQLDAALTVNGTLTVSNGGTLAGGRLEALSLSVVSTGLVTSLASTATQMHQLDLAVAGAVVVDATSRIDVSGQGYLAGRTSGNTTNGATGNLSGGSYGGLGGTWSTVNAVYGDYRTADDWGSGGGGGGCAGGGRVRVTAASLQLDGSLRANGTFCGGAGSGGGVLVVVGRLTGGGSIQAKGGDTGNNYAAGGGGRIAIYAGDSSGFNLANVSAAGGGGFIHGGAGSVYVKDTGAAAGTLVIDGGSVVSGRGDLNGWAVLGLPGTNDFTIPDAVVVRGAATRVQAEHAGLAVRFENTLTVTNGAYLQLGEAQFNGPEPLRLGSNSTLTVSGTLTSATPVVVTSGFVGVQRITAPAVSVVAGGTLSADQVSTPALTLTGASVLTCPASTASQMHLLDVEVSGAISVSTDSRIDVSGKGYLAGRTSGNTTNGATGNLSGGSYGGLGGTWSTVNAVYGDYTTADDWGSGGSSCAGGGRVRVAAASLQLDGSLRANGTACGGAGSGGGVLVVVGSLTGGGSIQAKGGDTGFNYAAGGGGRIAIYAQDYSGFNLANVSAAGGGGFIHGGAGSVYVKDTGAAAGTLVIDGGSVVSGRGDLNGWAVLGLPGTNDFTIPDAVVVRGAATRVQAEHAGLAVRFENTLTVTNGAYLQLGEAQFNGPEPLRLGSNSTLTVSGTLTSATPVVVTSGFVGVQRITAPAVSVVAGGTLSADQVSTPALTLTGASVLTCPASTASQMHLLDVEVSGAISVSTDSRIDVSGKGYLAGRTSGNTTNGATGNLSGGSYGGLGGTWSTVNAVYGDYTTADDWGSGGSSCAGGGRVRVAAASLQLDGSLRANGTACGGAGSGGGVLVVVGSLTGGGSIQAKGGDTGFNYAAGGGGRIAIYAQDYSGFNLANVSAAGGGGFIHGGAGSVYVKDTGAAAGTLVIDGGSVVSGRGDLNGWAVLGLPGTNDFTIPDAVVVRGAATRVQAEHAGLAVRFENTLTVTNGAYLQLGEAQFNGPEPLRLGSNSTLTVSGTLTSATPVVVTSGFVGVQRITAPAVSVVAGGTLSADQVSTPALTLTGASVLTCPASTASQMHLLDVEVSGAISVSTDSRIDVSGKGYLAGRTSGNTTNGATGNLSGGSYGGLGGTWSTVNAVYGDYTTADDWGSGGSSCAGGGRVRVAAASLQLDGSLRANGTACGGAGSGGGVLVVVGSLTGGGSIQAKGGDTGFNYAAGGGGRIAIYAQDYSGFNLANVSAAGGGGFIHGGAGSVYVKDTGAAAGTLVIDGGSVVSGRGDLNGWAVLGLPGTNDFTIPDAVVVRGAATRVQAEHAGLAVRFENTLTVTNGAYLQLGEAQFNGPEPLRLGSNSTLTVSGTLTSATPVVVTSGFVGVQRITAPAVSVVAGGTLSADQVSTPALTLTGASVLTCPASTASQMHLLDVEVSGAISVSTDSRIDVSGKGYLAGRTSGNTTNGATGNLSGGSYGGLGGTWSTVNAVYGDYTTADDWGSGGSSCAGGGRVRVAAASLQLDGSLRANGTACGGAGSGGGVLVVVGSLTGGGSIQAKGGDTGFNYAAGGGGRIAIYAQDYSGFNLANVSAAGGGGFIHGGAGSVYFTHDRLPTKSKLVYPLVRSGDSVRTLNHVSLEFTRDIATNSFSPAVFQIAGPLGQVLSTGIARVFARTYAITFPALTENGAYHFTLSPGLRDEDGYMLDQNGNGIPGEPDDAYTFTLILDTVPPRVTRHSPAGDVSGTASSIDVWFSEPMDKASLVPANARLTNTLGQAVSITAIQEVGLSRFRFSFPGQTTPGLYQLGLGTNITDLAGNALTPALSHPMGEGAITFNLVPVDLELSNVAPGTNELWAGDSITISWNGRNNSGASLLGDWIDAVYLSTDNRWDINDLLLATVPHTGGLASNEVYSAQAGVSVPGVLPGNYHLLVRADLANAQRETAETNNIVAFGPLPLRVRGLAANSPAFNGALTPGSRAHYFVINLAAGESLRLLLTGSGAGGVNHLFVSQGAIPSVMANDFRAIDAGQNQQIVLTGLPGGGTYYVLVYGDQVSGSNPYSLIAETAPFFITGVSPRRNSNFSLFNFLPPPATVTISGVGFDQYTTVEFIGGSGAVRTPPQTRFVSTSTLAVDLDILSWPSDTYDVRLTKDATSRVETNAFTVAFGFESFAARLVVPGALAPRFPTRQTVWIEYENSGNAAMVAPILTLSASQGALLTADADVAIAARTAPASVLAVSTNVQVMAYGSGATPGILQAGDRGRIPIYYLGLSNDNGAAQVNFTLNSSKAIAIGQRYNAAVGGTIPFVKDRFLLLNESSLRPESIPPGAWHAVFLNLRTQLGSDFRDYITRLAADMNHLAGIGQHIFEPGKLFNFEILKASAALNPVRTLARSVDASVPSPGFPLTFRRVYGQPMLSRYHPGPLGRGWSHNWDVSVQTHTNGGALLRGPLGADRFFRRTPAGAYLASPGDYGALALVSGAFQLVETDQTLWQFRTDGLLDSVRDSNNNRITCAYSGTNLVSLTHSSGQQLLLDYDGNGRLARLTEPLGPGAADDRVTTYGYAGEHLAAVTKPGNRVTRYAYHTTGTPQQLHALTNVTYPDLTQDSFAYDAQGRVIQTSQSCCGAQQVAYNYDSAGTVTVTDATGRSTVLAYGLGGQPGQMRDGEGRIVQLGYDASRQLSQLTGPGGETYRYTYGTKGALAAIEDPLRHHNAFDYEPAFNRLARITDARRNGLQYTYDPRGNLTAIIYADGTRESFHHDGAGNVLNSTNRRGQVITYIYNPVGQLTAKDYSTTPGLLDFTYAYDAAGNLTNATYFDTQLSTQAAIHLRHDPNTDRLTRIEFPDGRFFAFDYDASGRRTRRTDQDGHISVYLYDSLGRLTRMTNELGQTIVNYDYDPAGRLSRKTLGNGVFSSYTYNQAGQVTQLVNSRADSNVLSSFAYTYDASGRRASMTTLAGTETYGYDPLGQLTSVTYPNGRVVTYAYDAAGNRMQVTDNGVPTAYSANQLNQYTSVGGTNYLFDADGNLTNQLSTSYTYDSENRLIGVATPTDTWTYTYDAFGNRIAATHNGQTTRYVIDPTGLGNVAAEYDGGGSLIARYEHGFGLLARTDTAGAPAFYTFSAIGHTSELTGPSGAVANAYAYDPFGLSLAKTETIPNAFEFVGEFGVMNEGNGLEFMRARFYANHSARFLNPDPIHVRSGLNLYTYVENSPIAGIDPHGLASCFIGGNSPGNWLTWNCGGPDNPSDMLPFESYEDYVRRREFEKNGDQAIPDRPTQFDHPDRSDSSWSTLDEVEQGISREREQKEKNDWLDDLRDTNEERLRDQQRDFPPPPDPPEDNKEDEDHSRLIRSRDPNDKQAPAGFGAAAWRPVDSALAYTIRFENQPSATAPAQRIVITDTLDPNLDLSTLELTEITFANHIIPVPMGLNHYEARLPFTVGTNNILADVQATLDLPTRTLTLTLRATDPATGWFPEDPLAGLLYPNDATHRGEGSISYVVKPRAGVTTGTQIRNRARIVFDFNDAIETPQVFNTIDSGAPTSTVAPLPAEAGPAILVQWSGQDDTGGSGVASYDVYVAAVTNAADGPSALQYFRWQERTTATSAWWNGALGSTYAFYSVARDNVGNEQAAPVSPQAQTHVPTNAPVLNIISNVSAMVGQGISITNVLLSGTPSGSFVFSLGPGAPPGASINATNGIFRWTPNCSQASRTNVITVQVTDTGNPNITDLISFSVAVGECVVPGLGRVVLPTGASGRVPVNLISSVPLTNLSMTVETDTARLTNLSVEVIVPEVCSSGFSRLGGPPEGGTTNAYLLSLTTCPAQILIGTQQVAWLNFTAATGQSSAFVSLKLDNGVGLQPDGTEVRNFAPQAGRTVVVGNEPLLEAVLSSNRQPALILYGRPGPDYFIEGKPRLDSALPWQVVWQGTQSNLFQQIQPVSGTNRMMFFRARRVSLPNLTARLQAGQLIIEWPSAAGNCVLLESASVGALAAWETISVTPQLSGGTYRVAVSIAGGNKFYRLRCVP